MGSIDYKSVYILKTWNQEPGTVNTNVGQGIPGNKKREMETLVYSQHQVCLDTQMPWPSELRTTPTMSDRRSPLSDLYFQLSQVLQGEMWWHSQTRSQLVSELENRLMLEEQLRKLKEDIDQWRKTCEMVYESLNEHRAEASRLREELQEVTSELGMTKRVGIFPVAIK